MLIEVAKEEFEKFKAEAGANGWGWPVALSTNHWREVWPPPGRGFTQPDDRRRLYGRFPFIGRIVDAYLKERPEGGRFFIDDQLVYYRPEEDNKPCYAIAAIAIAA